MHHNYGVISGSHANFFTENYQRNIFKKPLLFILIKPNLLIWKITLFIEFQVMPVKNQFRVEELLFRIM